MPRKIEGTENVRVAIRRDFLPRFSFACRLENVSQTSCLRAFVGRYTEAVLAKHGHPPTEDLVEDDTAEKPARIKGGGKDRSVFKVVGSSESVKLYELKIDNKISLALAGTQDKPQRSVFITADQARLIARALLRHAENIEGKEE